MLNIDLTNSQFSLQQLYEDSKKLGLDLEDLEQHGFDSHALNCVKTGCKKMDKAMSIEEMVGYNSEVLKKLSSTLLEGQASPWKDSARTPGGADLSAKTQ